ncbi:MAG TPA: DUF4097 family beta strand repeat-containing protein [Myxococcales bacterium]|nr:DUF4097 family beta strand repeat-containing protein [Myxococcales bacterium]
MIAVPILLSTLLAQAAPPAIDLSGLRAGLRAMREDLSRMQLDDEAGDQSWSFAFANPQDDDEDDDDDQEVRDRAREERERQKERVREERERAREQAQEARERAQEQAERARERAQQQAERARERAQEKAEKFREKQDKFREKQDKFREDDERFRFRFNWSPFTGADDDEEEDDADLPSTRAKAKNGVATLPAKGPVTVRVRAQSGEVEVVGSDRPQVTAVLSEVPSRDEIQLTQSGDRIDVQVGSRKALRRGKLRVEAPKGSSVIFESTSADLDVKGIGGDVRVQTMSGDIKVSGVRKANVETISGDVSVDANGPIRLHTVSGNAVASTTDPGVRLDFESASGNLDWSGACAKGCRVSTETVSGQIAMAVDPRSSFELSYSSHSGDFKDDLNLNVKRSQKKKHGGMGGWVEAVYGKGEGVIECDAFSGDLQIRKK